MRTKQTAAAKEQLGGEEMETQDTALWLTRTERTLKL